MLGHASAFILTLQGLGVNSFQISHTFDIDCSTLINANNIQALCNQNVGIQAMYGQLVQIKSPVLYWFEITSNHIPRDVYNALSEYRNSKQKSVPALKKNLPDWDSTVVYVGKRKNSFDGRVTQHLGYYEVQTTQGLQLCHWAKDLNLKLQLNVIALPLGLEPLLGAFEIELAKMLQPIAGKHR